MIKGSQHTIETRTKISASLKGRKGRHHTDEARMKISSTLTGRKLSLKHRAKLSVVRRGKKNTPEVCAKISKALKGRQFSPEHLMKLSKAHEGKKHTAECRAKMGASRTREKNPNWMGGISYLPYSWKFNNTLKEKIRKRDDYKCQLCGVPQMECTRRLCIHHIDYDKKNSDPVNLVALCDFCHARTNTNREHWKAIFRAEMVKENRR